MGTEFQLPQNAYAVALFKSPEYILLATDTFENTSTTSFYFLCGTFGESTEMKCIIGFVFNSCLQYARNFSQKNLEV